MEETVLIVRYQNIHTKGLRWVRRVAHMEGKRYAPTAYEGNLKERNSSIQWRT